MEHRYRFLYFAAVLGCCLQSSSAATVTQTYAGSLPVTLTGTLPNQGTALAETLTLPSAGTVTITTSSYATGGFETNLLLFTAAGGFLSASIPFGSPDPATRIVGDSRLIASNLSAGTYIVALSDFLLNQALDATNLSSGFNFNLGSGTTFVDANGNSRSGNYAFTISATGASAVPEPSSFFLAVPLLLLAMWERKRFGRSIYVTEGPSGGN